MQPTDHKPPRGPGVSAGPDLLRKAAAAPGDDGRILARLEHGDAAFAPSPSLQRRRGRIAAAAAVLALLAGVLAWTFYQNTRSTLDMRSLPADLALRVNGAASGHAPASVAASPPEATPAAIVNEMPAAPAQAANAEPLAPAKARTPPAVAAAPARPAVKPITTPATTPATPLRKADARTDDGDVALLTALVAHANNQTVPAPPDAPPPASRDVVQDRAGETTESLLLRCKQLGLIEGMLCHSRICSGRWDSEPACK